MKEYDIAIIGGGISGIYSGWRLKTESAEHKNSKIAIFEGQNRTGGRLLSALPPSARDVPAEMGGMRIVSTQKLAKSLADMLKLPQHEQVVDRPENLAYVRGETLRVKELGIASKLPYKIRPDEKAWLEESNGNTASDFIGFAVTKLFPEVSSLHGEKLEKFLQSATIGGTPLYKHGFWNILAKALSNEAYELALNTVGYDSLGMNANAVDCIAEYFNFTPDVKYYLLNDGFDALPWTLQQQFEDAGGEVHMNHWLQGFESAKMDDGSNGFELTFNNDISFKCKSLILAMPKRSLELLSASGPLLDPRKQPHVRFMMNAVEPVELYKIFLVYEEPWWEKCGVTEGRSLTDLPLRQCYYWAVENRGKKNQRALLMAYNDMLNSTFWGGLRPLPLGSGDARKWVYPGGVTSNKINDQHVFESKLAKDKGSNPWESRLLENWRHHPAPIAMVKQMHDQMKELHNMPDAPEPIDAAFMDWADDPFGGAVHFWNPGYKSWEVMNDIIQPVKDLPCYICGEAYSTNQTWVEGALQTAEIMLKKFGLTDPKWLSHD